MARATSSTQAKKSTPTPTGNRWNMSRWSISSSNKGVSLFEALGITKGSFHYPQFQPQLPSQVAAAQKQQTSTNQSSGPGSTRSTGGNSGGPSPAGSPQAIAKQLLAQNGWSNQFGALNNIITRESGWNVHATNPSSGAYGIPQALPGSKMASAGKNWQTDAATQLRWMMGYIRSRYGDPNKAWAFWQAHGWY